MATIIEQRPHFVPSSDVPTLPFWSSLTSAFRTLSYNSAGGLICKDGDTPYYYITAEFLRESAEQIASKHGWAKVPMFTIHDALHENALALDLDVAPMPPKVVSIVQRPVMAIDDPSDLYVPEYRVYRIIDLSGSDVGWFFNHETLEGTVHVAPPQFLCVDGHSNPDTDSGLCYHCPKPIQSSI